MWITERATSLTYAPSHALGVLLVVRIYTWLTETAKALSIVVGESDFEDKTRSSQPERLKYFFFNETG